MCKCALSARARLGAIALSDLLCLVTWKGRYANAPGARAVLYLRSQPWPCCKRVPALALLQTCRTALTVPALALLQTFVFCNVCKCERESDRDHVLQFLIGHKLRTLSELALAELRWPTTTPVSTSCDHSDTQPHDLCLWECPPRRPAAVSCLSLT